MKLSNIQILQFPRRAILGYFKVRCRLVFDLINTALRVVFPQGQSLFVIDIEHSKICHNSVHAFRACDWQVTLLLDLGLSVLVDMRLDDHDFRLGGVGDKILQESVRLIFHWNS